MTSQNMNSNRLDHQICLTAGSDLTDILDVEDEGITPKASLQLNKYKFLCSRFNRIDKPSSKNTTGQYSSNIPVEEKKPGNILISPVSIICAKRVMRQKPLLCNMGDASPPPLSKLDEISPYMSKINSSVGLLSPNKFKLKAVDTRKTNKGEFFEKDSQKDDYQSLSHVNIGRNICPENISIRNQSRKLGLKPILFIDSPNSYSSLKKRSTKKDLKSNLDFTRATPANASPINWNFSRRSDSPTDGKTSKCQSICRIDSTKDVEELLRQNPDYQEYLREYTQTTKFTFERQPQKKIRLRLQLTLAGN